MRIKRKLVGAGTLLAVGIALSACASTTTVSTGSTAAATPGPAVTTPAPASTATATRTMIGPVAPATTPSSTSKAFAEIADHIPFVQLWTNNLGTQASANLPFNTTVQVQCLAANESGSASADPGFYKFVYNGQTYYAISNEFANGDPVGQPGSTTVDPKVPTC